MLPLSACQVSLHEDSTSNHHQYSALAEMKQGISHDFLPTSHVKHAASQMPSCCRSRWLPRLTGLMQGALTPEFRQVDMSNCSFLFAVWHEKCSQTCLPFSFSKFWFRCSTICKHKRASASLALPLKVLHCSAGDAVTRLMNLGFDRQMAQHALQMCNGDVDRAAALLFEQSMGF